MCLERCLAFSITSLALTKVTAVSLSCPLDKNFCRLSTVPNVAPYPCCWILCLAHQRRAGRVCSVKEDDQSGRSY